MLPFGKARLDRAGNAIDKVRLTDRFFLGEPEMRGFDIRGVGPRVQRVPYNVDGTLSTDKSTDFRRRHWWPGLLQGPSGA